jgi:hypothetical protein
MVLGQKVNPVKVLDAEQINDIYARAAAAPPHLLELTAFRARGVVTDPHIYVNRDSAIYRAATSKPSALKILKLAATLAHEQVHNTDGELAAYRLQADFVRSKLEGVPRRQRKDACAYLQSLEAKAQAIAYVTWLEAPSSRPLRRNVAALPDHERPLEFDHRRAVLVHARRLHRHDADVRP